MTMAQALACVFLVCSAVSATACSAPPSTPASRATEPVGQPPTSAPASTAEPQAQPIEPSPGIRTPARPPLRRLFAAHPQTVARQVPVDNDARIDAHLAAHPETPARIAAAMRAHELWLGMTEAEVVLSVGPASRKELVPGKPRAYGLFYADEGWFLSFDEHGYLYELVER